MGWFSHYLCSYIFELLQYTEHMAHASTILVMEGRMEQGASNHTVAGMKGSPGTELCCLLGADGGIGIFRGKKGAFAAEQLLCS